MIKLQNIKIYNRINFSKTNFKIGYIKKYKILILIFICFYLYYWFKIIRLLLIKNNKLNELIKINIFQIIK